MRRYARGAGLPRRGEPDDSLVAAVPNRSDATLPCALRLVVHAAALALDAHALLTIFVAATASLTY